MNKILFAVCNYRGFSLLAKKQYKEFFQWIERKKRSDYERDTLLLFLYTEKQEYSKCCEIYTSILRRKEGNLEEVINLFLKTIAKGLYRNKQYDELVKILEITKKDVEHDRRLYGKYLEILGNCYV